MLHFNAESNYVRINNDVIMFVLIINLLLIAFTPVAYELPN